jgi:hypothetical protein
VRTDAGTARSDEKKPKIIEPGTALEADVRGRAGRGRSQLFAGQPPFDAIIPQAFVVMPVVGVS